MSKSEGLEQFLLPRRLERMDQIVKNRSENLSILLDRVHHQHNISAVLRSAEAFGLQTVHIVGGGGGFNSGITQGAERWLDLHQHEDAETAAIKLKQLGYKLILVQPEEQGKDIENTDIKSVPILSLPFEKKLALVFGSEKEGISTTLHKHAFLTAYIPMYGFVESLNISVAAAICMFCSTFQKAQPDRPLSCLSEKRQNEVKQQWVKNDIRNSEAVQRELKLRKAKEL